MKAEINKRVELIQVLPYLAQEQGKTVQHLENKTYSKSIADWLGPYKDHAAVKITKKLITENSFIHIRPLMAILELENILNEDSHKLKLWAVETVRFAEESRFEDFFHAQGDYYAGNYGFRIAQTAYTVRCMPVYDEKGEPNGRLDYFAMGSMRNFYFYR